MACARTQIQFLIKRNGILIGHLKNNYVYHLTDMHVTFYYENPTGVQEVELIFINWWTTEVYPITFDTATLNHIILQTNPLPLSITLPFHLF